jgi:hypothetical protein
MEPADLRRKFEVQQLQSDRDARVAELQGTHSIILGKLANAKTGKSWQAADGFGLTLSKSSHGSERLARFRVGGQHGCAPKGEE